MEAGRRCSILMMMTVSCGEDTCGENAVFTVASLVCVLDCTIK